MNDKKFAAKDHSKKVKSKLFAHRTEYGVERGVRLDIPSVMRGIEVVAIHAKANGGKVIGYDHSATISNVRFIVQKGGANKVGAKGGNKFPFAYIGGTLVDQEPRAVGTKLYYDPRKVHLFVDSDTMRPVKSAKKVYLIGKQMYAVGLVYYKPSEVPAAPEGMKSEVRIPSAIGLSTCACPTLKKNYGINCRLHKRSLPALTATFMRHAKRQKNRSTASGGGVWKQASYVLL